MPNLLIQMTGPEYYRLAADLTAWKLVYAVESSFDSGIFQEGIFQRIPDPTSMRIDPLTAGLNGEYPRRRFHFSEMKASPTMPLQMIY